MMVEPTPQHFIAALIRQRDDALNKLANSDAMVAALEETLKDQMEAGELLAKERGELLARIAELTPPAQMPEQEEEN